ncbi:MAG: zf-HC2 domain-containing protein [Treponema sp.]|nr:zf-HC2 domain-containing protein [Treponema sp.]
MCPDRQILSLYVDDELPSPWKEKFEAHLVSCTDCRNQMGNYSRLRATICEDKIDIPENVQSRVWEKIIAGGNKGPIIAERAYSPIPEKNSRRFWNRSINLPVPAAAAAAAVFLLAAFLAVQGIQSANVPGSTGVIADVNADSQGVLPMSDINDVLQYLSKEDNSNYVTINLPDSRNFSTAGEPALIKAADYSRRNTVR